MPLDEETAYKLTRLTLAERFGWTFEYIDSFDTWDYEETLMLLDAKDKAIAYLRRSAR